jgi:hypothetical protein
LSYRKIVIELRIRIFLRFEERFDLISLSLGSIGGNWLFGEELADVGKGPRLEGIARRIEKKPGYLFATFALEPNIGSITRVTRARRTRSARPLMFPWGA